MESVFTDRLLFLQDGENTDGTTSWRCDQKIDGRKCSGRVKTDGAGGVESVTEHACALKPSRVKVSVTYIQDGKSGNGN